MDIPENIPEEMARQFKERASLREEINSYFRSISEYTDEEIKDETEIGTIQQWNIPAEQPEE